MYLNKSVKHWSEHWYKSDLQATGVNVVHCTTSRSLSLTHTYTLRLQRVCLLTMLAVCPHATEDVQLQLPAACTQNTLWNEMIWHTSLRAPCVAAPAEAWAEMLPADWPLRPLVSMGLIINCHGLRQAWGRPAIVGWASLERECRKWLLSEIKHSACIPEIFPHI